MTKKYFSAIFTVETWEEFLNNGSKIMGYPERKKASAQKINKDDYLICYLSKLSRFVGVLEVKSDMFFDDAKIWNSGIFPNRFEVKVIEKLNIENALPIIELKEQLQLFKKLKNPNIWAGFFMAAPREFDSEDGKIIIKSIEEAKKNPIERPYDKKLANKNNT